MDSTTGPLPMSDRDKDREEMREARRRHDEHSQSEPQCSTSGPLCDEPRGRRLTREAMKPSARDLLLQQAAYLRHKAGYLEALAGQLPSCMTPEAEQGLIQLLIR